MLYEDIKIAISIGFLLAIMLGPVFFIVLETAAIKGFRAALALDLGVVLADVVFIYIAYLSTNQLLEKIKDEPALFIFGGVLLISYGVITFIQEKKIALSRRNISVELINKHNYFRLLFKGFLLNFINIGVLGFWLTIIITIAPQLEMNITRIISFFSLILGVYLVLDMGKMVLAKTLKRKLTIKRIFYLKRGVSVLMIAFGIVLLSKGLFPKSAENLQHQIEEVNPFLKKVE